MSLLISKGKVRDNYDVGEGRLVLVTTDRMSAFDVVLPQKVPNKGMVLNKISAFWFGYVQDIMPNHMITINNSEMPDDFQGMNFIGRSMMVWKLKMLPVECIVRGYITGSGWDSYQETGSVCGIELPAGLRESEKLQTPIYTPMTKAETGHDEAVSFDDTVGILGRDTAELLRDKSIEIYSKCAAYALTKGIIIADTKFEFGVDENGVVVLADEVMTPDSSRFWPAAEYEVGKAQKSFDKQYLRDYLKGIGWNKQPPAPVLPANVIEVTAGKYIEAYELLTGSKF